ncbi:hypothetical protein REPUB_Repub06bG0044700 [Reevesia pubescens]
MQVDYFDHEHPLSFNEFIKKNESIDCEACCLKISGEAYACKSCEYYLHKACTQLPYEVLHPLHPQHSLKLFIPNRRMWPMFACYECREYSFGFAYLCSPCGFLLHMKCPKTLSIPKYEGQRLKEMESQRSKLCPFNQYHKINFFNCGSNLSKFYFCNICPRKLKGPSYECINCQYKVHESCFGFPLELQLQFHPQHRLHTCLNVREKCFVCKESVDIGYSCLQCRFHLHLYCAKALKRVIKSKSHMHNLYYFQPNVEKDSYVLKICGECKKLILHHPTYFCLECGIVLHFKCAQIPYSVKSKYHIHPFTLKDHFMEDDSGEYYCDICEEERYPEDHVYYCTKCQGSIVAHIDCVLTSVSPHHYDLLF